MYQPQRLPPGAHRRLGKKDQAGRWRPHDYYRSLFRDVPAPTARDPHTYYRHVETMAFAGKLYKDSPYLYASINGVSERKHPRQWLEMMNIDEESEQGQAVLAKHVALKMKGRL